MEMNVTKFICPHCGKSHFTVDYQTRTLAGCYLEAINGKLKYYDPNVTTYHCTCLECGNRFSYKEGSEVDKFESCTLEVKSDTSQLDKETLVRNCIGKVDNSLTNIELKLVQHCVDDSLNSGQYYTINLVGGLNGNGKFSDYLKAVESLIVELEKKFSSVWLCSWQNDCPDDVWSLTIGVRD